VDPISLAAVVVLVPLVLALLSRGSLASVGPGELRYGRLFRWFSLLTGLVPPLAVLTIVLFVQKRPLRPDERLPVVLLIIMFPTLALPLLVEFFRVRHRYDHEGLSFRSPWSKPRSIAWIDVASVRWRPVWKALAFKTNTGVTVNLSPWLAGLRPFADVALARIPAVVLISASPDARAVLHLLSAGVAGELMTSPLTPEKLLAARAPRAAAPSPTSRSA
jgi:hypothetical protein